MSSSMTTTNNTAAANTAAQTAMLTAQTDKRLLKGPIGSQGTQVKAAEAKLGAIEQASLAAMLATILANIAEAGSAGPELAQPKTELSPEETLRFMNEEMPTTMTFSPSSIVKLTPHLHKGSATLEGMLALISHQSTHGFGLGQKGKATEFDFKPNEVFFSVHHAESKPADDPLHSAFHHGTAAHVSSQTLKGGYSRRASIEQLTHSNNNTDDSITSGALFTMMLMFMWVATYQQVTQNKATAEYGENAYTISESAANLERQAAKTKATGEIGAAISEGVVAATTGGMEAGHHTEQIDHITNHEITTSRHNDALFKNQHTKSVENGNFDKISEEAKKLGVTTPKQNQAFEIKTNQQAIKHEQHSREIEIEQGKKDLVYIHTSEKVVHTFIKMGNSVTDIISANTKQLAQLNQAQAHAANSITESSGKMLEAMQQMVQFIQQFIASLISLVSQTIGAMASAVSV